MSAPRTEDAPSCAICGREGKALYLGLKDRLFGVDGSFGYRECGECGLIWLDPRPIKEDIHKCYESYFDSLPRPDSGENTAGPGRIFFSRIKNVLRAWILCGCYGYRHLHNTHIICKAGKLLRMIPLLGERATYQWGPLMPRFNGSPGAMIVDIGCGKGDYLAILKEMGWKVLGIEPDPVSARKAVARGISIFEGVFEDSRLPDGSCDMVTMRHSIEHLPDPLGTINECFRILKKGGRLVLRTPNSESLGRRIFNSNWSALEPPRHLYVFSPKSLKALFAKTPFSVERVRTLALSAVLIYDLSGMIKKDGVVKHGRVIPQRGRGWFAFKEIMLSAAGKDAGEEAELVARK